MRKTEIGFALIPMAVTVAVVGSACSQWRAQNAVQTGLTATAEALVTVDEIMAEEIVEARDRAIERTREDSQDVEQYIALMLPWYEATAAIEAAGDGLQALQAGVNIWRDSGNLDANFWSMCQEIETALEEILSVLERLDVDVPRPVAAAISYTGEICSLARPWVTDGGSDG